MANERDLAAQLAEEIMAGMEEAADQRRQDAIAIAKLTFPAVLQIPDQTERGAAIQQLGDTISGIVNANRES
jgi:hypothetical protein